MIYLPLRTTAHRSAASVFSTIVVHCSTRYFEPENLSDDDALLANTGFRIDSQQAFPARVVTNFRARRPAIVDGPARVHEMIRIHYETNAATLELTDDRRSRSI